MPDIIARVGVLILVSLLLWLSVRSGRRFIDIQRERALAAPPLVERTDTGIESTDSGTSPVRILAFSSADCKQCHQLQAPALLRVQEIHGVNVAVVEVDAPTSPELLQRYHVLTLPTTVVLNATGRAHAVNYGFANTQRLLEQVDAVLSQVQQSAS
jgi:thioredoxin-like negative regulator of GroEL